MAKGDFWRIIFLFLSVSFPVFSQNDYLVYFKDKNNSPYSIDNPQAFLSDGAIARRSKQKISIVERDLPVNPDYVSQLKANGVQVRYVTKWLNGAVIRATSDQISQIQNFSFIKGNSALNRVEESIISLNRNESKQDKYYVESSQPINYGGSINQLGILGLIEMHSMGYTGKGIKVAIFDSGFQNANTLSCFNHLFSNGKIKATYNIAKDKVDVYDAGTHGLNVFSLMGAFSSNEIIGGAYEADYFLYHTEVIESEYPVEEANWLRAAEMADSAGVDIINSSLGYTDFDKSIFNHTYADMNGSSTIVSRAADIASQCGILVVNSAGNYGNGNWKYIVAPGDVASVLTVGAVDNNKNYASFSSRGPTSDLRLKPDVAAPGSPDLVMNPGGAVSYGYGTSFSAPLIASFAAGLWQAYPYLTNSQINTIIKKSSSQFDSPDYQLGYGIPNFSKAFEIGAYYSSSGSFTIYPNPSSSDQEVYLRINEKDVYKKMEVSLIDNLGHLIFTKVFENSYEINWLNLKSSLLLPGCYFVKVKFSGSNQKTFKLIYY